MSGYPIRRDIVLRGDSASLVHQKDYHRRLELLFNVHVNVTSSKLHYKDRSDGGELVVENEDIVDGWVTVRGKSEEDCLKTQRYVLASSKPECRVLVPCGPQLLKVLFEDSPNLRDAIERECEVLFVAAPKDGGLYIQGSQSSVSVAIRRVYSLADTIKSHSTACKVPPSTIPIEHDRQNLVIRDPNSIPNTGPRYNQEMPPSQLQHYSPDVKIQKLVNQYVQLGFPIDKVQAVIESLGPHACENDIMSKLILSNPMKPAPPVTSCSPSLSKEGLRPIVIDGSNVAMKHGNGKVFSCRGIEIALNYFYERGHSDITIFVPNWRKEPSRPETPIKDQEILSKLENAGILKFTPSRRLGNKKIVCYDDRFIVKLAHDKGGVIVSDDNFRDLFNENISWRETIEKHVLQFLFVDDSFMVPDDPLGKHGPRLDTFLQFEGGLPPYKESDMNSIPKDKTPCPYKEKCTFGPRCRYYHPPREQKRDKSVGEDPSNGRSKPSGHDIWRDQDMSAKMKSLKVNTSPQKVIMTQPIQYADDRPQISTLRHPTHPLVHPPINHSSAPLLHKDRSDAGISPYSMPHLPHHAHGQDQWGGRGHEEHKVMNSHGMPERHFEKLDISYSNYSDSPMAMSPAGYPSSPFQHPHSHSHARPHTHPQLVHPSHLHHPEYHHYSMQHHPHHSSHQYTCNGGGFYVKNTRELDQIQSLEANQKVLFDKAVELYPQYRDRILAHIVQFRISDMNTLRKSLGK